MARMLSLTQALKVWGATIVSAALFIFGSQLSDRLIANPAASPTIRWLAVAVAAGSIMPWALLTVWLFGTTDEFVRHIVLVGTAIAFVGDVVIHIAFSVMVDAHLTGPNTYLPELGVAMLLWLFGVGLATLYYRLRP
jgi:hypothetical protein